MTKSTINRSDFTRAMQRFVAIGAMGPSSLRNQGEGVLGAAQRHLGSIDLSSIPSASGSVFAAWLEENTQRLLDHLPVQTRPWGTARKAINLFLRSCLYNHHLREEYRLIRVEPWLEIPLDRAVAQGLKRKAGRGNLPRWTTLKDLTSGPSERFQAYAERLAKDLGLAARVHLDVYLWPDNR